ncbi:unnamed protein product, partial [Allacma fusca]
VNGASQKDIVGDEAGSEIVPPAAAAAAAADTEDTRGDIVSNGEDGTCSDKDEVEEKSYCLICGLNLDD